MSNSINDVSAANEPIFIADTEADLGVANTKNNLSFLTDWLRSEGTTIDANPLGIGGASGLQSYASTAAGAQAVASLLQSNPKYTPLVAGLQSSQDLSYYTTGPGSKSLLTWDPAGGDIRTIESISGEPSTITTGQVATAATAPAAPSAVTTGFLNGLNALLNPGLNGNVANDVIDIASLGTVPLMQIIFIRGSFAAIGVGMVLIGFNGLLHGSSGKAQVIDIVGLPGTAAANVGASASTAAKINAPARSVGSKIGGAVKDAAMVAK